MKKFFLMLALLLVCTMQAQEQPTGRDNKYNHVAISALSPLSLSPQSPSDAPARAEQAQGLSASFAGVVNGRVLVAGGCNFAETPAAEGGRKIFYNAAFLLEDDGSWRQVGELPVACAYGMSVTVDDGVVCIGGTDGGQALSAVFLLQTDGQNQLKVKKLPALPAGVEQGAAGYDAKGYIYVAGGKVAGKSSTAAWRLKYPGGTRWEALPPMPGRGRIQPAGVVQNGSTGPLFLVLGGYDEAAGAQAACVHENGVVYDPRTNAWKTTAPIAPDGRPMAIVGATAVTSGYSHVVCFGGVNREIFLDAITRPARLAAAQEQGDTALVARLEQEQAAYLLHPETWYQFNDELLIYHTITDTWVTESRSPKLARAGAAVVRCGNRWVVVNGESKPGIRSTDVTAVSMTVRTDFGWLNWTVLALYLLGMLALGFYFMRREGGSEDFFKGGGRIPWWAAGISIYATMLSAITYMAYPAKAYATDWTYYPMLVTILIVSFPVIHYYLPFFRRLNVTTAYEYLERRFNAATRLMASALFIIFMIARMALVLYLPSLALTAVTGIDIYICIVLMGLITIVYCTMGGVEAVVWGDVVQGIILVGGAIFAVGYLVLNTDGGVGGFLDIGMTDGKFRLFDWSLDYRSATFWVIILGGMANNLISYTSDQTVIQRYLTTKDERSARRSIMMNGVMSVFISVAFFAIGAGLYTFFKTHPAELDYTMAKADTIFPFFMMSQLPAGLAGLLIAAIFAATMSTISSNINSVATAFSVDFYRRWRPQTDDRRMLAVARRACVISGLIGMAIALLMATWEILSLLDFFQEILGLLSSGLGGLFLMGIFFPRIGGRAALVGFCTGVAAVFLTKYFTEASFLLYGFIGMAVSVFTAYLLSFLLREDKNLAGLTWQTLTGRSKPEA